MMHIMEGYLPLKHAAAWTLVSMPFVTHGVREIRRHMQERPQAKLLLGVAGAYAFVLSALKLPSVTGSSSHPTGVGLGAVLFGPGTMTVISTVVLLFQALLLAHGGLTTLGANAFAMGVVGPWVAYGVYRLVRGSRGSLTVATFLAAATGNLATYVVTSFQLALAFPDPATGFVGALTKFIGIFALTQLPLAVTEGLLTALAIKYLGENSRSELQDLSVISPESQ